VEGGDVNGLDSARPQPKNAERAEVFVFDSAEAGREVERGELDPADYDEFADMDLAAGYWLEVSAVMSERDVFKPWIGEHSPSRTRRPYQGRHPAPVLALHVWSPRS
jgi:hypothetical protein